MFDSIYKKNSIVVLLSLFLAVGCNKPALENKAQNTSDIKTQQKFSSTSQNKKQEVVRRGEPFLLPYSLPDKWEPIENSEELLKERDKKRGLSDTLIEKLYNTTITCEFDNEPLESVIQHLNKKTTLKIRLDSNVEGDQQITLSLQDLPLKYALSIIRAFTDLDYKAENDSSLLLIKKESN